MYKILNWILTSYMLIGILINSLLFLFLIIFFFCKTIKTKNQETCKNKMLKKNNLNFQLLNLLYRYRYTIYINVCKYSFVLNAKYYCFKFIVSTYTYIKVVWSNAHIKIYYIWDGGNNAFFLITTHHDIYIYHIFIPYAN